MKILKLFVAGIMLCAVAGCNANAPKIGVVDVARAVNGSNQGKAANAQLKALIKAKQDELKLKANTIADLKKKYSDRVFCGGKKSC